jgi:O-antigen ligase
MWVAMRVTKGEGDIRIYISAFLLGALLASIQGLLSHFNIVNVPPELGGKTYNRDSFIYITSSVVRYMGSGGFILATTFPLVLLSGAGRPLRVPLWGYVLSFLPVAISYRRSAYFALLFSVLYLLVFNYGMGWRVIRWFAIGAMLVGALSLTSTVGRNIVSRFSSSTKVSTDFTLLSRVDAWLGGWRMFKSSPIVGVGINQYAANFQRYVLPTFPWSRPDITYATDANSDYVQYLATTGLVGFVVIYSFFGISMVRFHRLAHISSGFPRAVYFGTSALLIALLVFSFVEDPLYNKNFITLLFFFLGMAQACASGRLLPKGCRRTRGGSNLTRAETY